MALWQICCNRSLQRHVPGHGSQEHLHPLITNVLEVNEGEVFWGTCLSSAEMGSPSCSQNNSNASSSAASRIPIEQGRHKLCSTCWKCPSSYGSSFSLNQTKLWPERLHSFLSLTHTPTAVTKLNEAEIHSLPFPCRTPTNHSETAETWKLSRSFLLWRLWTPSDTANTLHSGSHPKRGLGV